MCMPRFRKDTVAPAIALTAPLGADLCGGSPDSRAIGTCMAVTSAVSGLVLFD
jgi:hypothetical protein